ncbi:MAG: cyclodeaminase/cyclohydrolase family protein [Vulcanimicrobiota bacterium]
MMLLEKTVNEFISLVASSSPAPGGGSVSGLSGSLAAALLAMAVRVSTRSPGDSEEPYIRELEQIEKESCQLVEEDTEAFNQVMAAYGMAKATDEDKSIRKIAIQEALKIATRVPLRTAEVNHRLLVLAGEIAVFCKSGCLSDAATGSYMAEAGLKGALSNVYINISSLKDEEFCKEVREKAAQLESALTTLPEQIQSVVQARMG